MEREGKLYMNTRLISDYTCIFVLYMTRPGHDVTTVASLQCLCDGAELLRMAGGKRKRLNLQTDQVQAGQTSDS